MIGCSAEQSCYTSVSVTHSVMLIVGVRLQFCKTLIKQISLNIESADDHSNEWGQEKIVVIAVAVFATRSVN